MSAQYVKTGWLAVLVAFLVGCDTQPGDDFGEAETHVLNINSSEVTQGSLYDRFTLKEVIPLDTAKAALVNSGMLGRAIFMDDKIVLTDFSPVLRVFNRRDGTLYKAINRSGRGPEEYSDRGRMFLQDGKQLVARGFDQSLMYYDIDGNFIKKNEATKNTSFMGEIYNVPGGFLVFKGLAGLYTHKEMDKPYYSVIYLSEAGDTLGQLLSIPITWPKVPVMSAVPMFRKHKGALFLTPVTDNKIYLYREKDTTFFPAYVLNLDGIDLNAVMERSAKAEGEAKLQFQQEMFMPMVMGITDHYILVNLSKMGTSAEKSKIIQLLINRETNEYEIFDLAPGDGGLVSNDEGLLVRMLDYSDLTDEAGNVPDTPLTRRIREITPITERMNGVLCIYGEK